MVSFKNNPISADYLSRTQLPVSKRPCSDLLFAFESPFIFYFQDKCAKHPGTKPSLWSVYFKVYGFKLFVAGLLKIMSDLCELVGPLVIGGLTSYVSTLSYPKETEPVKMLCRFVLFLLFSFL